MRLLTRREAVKCCFAAGGCGLAAMSLGCGSNDPIESIRKAAEGDVFTLGEYPYGHELDIQPILWRVLAKEENRALVVSYYGLDCRQFNSSEIKGNDWYSSDLRAWLNGSFKSTAFSSEELQIIEEITCLSADEAKKYFKYDNDRICERTRYADSLTPWMVGGPCSWWLRSPAAQSRRLSSSWGAAIVTWEGKIDSEDGRDVDEYTFVRPAMWLQL